MTDSSALSCHLSCLQCTPSDITWRWALARFFFFWPCLTLYNMYIASSLSLSPSVYPVGYVRCHTSSGMLLRSKVTGPLCPSGVGLVSLLLNKCSLVRLILNMLHYFFYRPRRSSTTAASNPKFPRFSWLTTLCSHTENVQHFVYNEPWNDDLKVNVQLFFVCLFIIGDAKSKTVTTKTLNTSPLLIDTNKRAGLVNKYSN